MDIVKKIKNYTYNQRHCLGEGSFGRVYEGKSDQGLKIAIKKVQQSMVSKDPYLRSSLQTQINIMKKLNHPNIVKLFDVVITSNSIYLIMEYCAGGDLKRYCRNKKISQDQATIIIKQITKGFQQIVQLGIIHRDLKPANILVHEGVFKICDFGFAKFFNDASRMTRTCVGTPIYMSPQVLCQKSYTDKTDVWSLGILYFELLFGKLPYYGNTEDALYKNIVRGTLTIPTCSNFSATLLRGMLQIDQNKRFSWSKLFQLYNLPAEQNNIKQQGYYNGSQKQILLGNQNNMGFYKPVEIKKQPSNNGFDKIEFQPQLYNNFKQSYADKYANIQILDEDKKLPPQRKPKNPLAFQNPVPILNVNQNQQQYPQNQPQYPQQNQVQNQPQIVPMQMLNQGQKDKQQNNISSSPVLPIQNNSAQNPRFLYFVLIELIVDPIKNSVSYPQLVSAIYKRTLQLYSKQIQNQKSNKNSLYSKILSNEFQQIKSLQPQIPNFTNNNLQKTAEAVLRQCSETNGGNASSSLVWVYKILNKNYTYQR